MKGHGTKFGRKKEAAVIALMTQRNLDDAAKSIGVVPNTLLRWMKDPEFDKAYREARRKSQHIETRLRNDCRDRIVGARTGEIFQ